MKWRCAYCGKPHEENDPPCDNCGNSEFEKAVVPLAPEAEDEAEYTNYVWVCTECGNDHPKNTPPCDRCGSGPLERREQTFDEDEVVAEMLGEDDDSDFSADVSYLDVLDAKLMLGFVGVFALVAVLGLGYVGVIDVPGITSQGVPTVDAPGDGTTVGSLSLAAVEGAYVDSLNDRRSADGYVELAREEDLAAVAAYVNKNRVLAASGRETATPTEGISAAIESTCRQTVSLDEFTVPPGALPGGAAADYGAASDLGGDLVTYRLNETDGQFVTAGADGVAVGVDVHVGPEGRVYVTQVVC